MTIIEERKDADLTAHAVCKVTCPPHSRHEGDICGCGSGNVVGPDDEGLYDCVDCGLFFDPAKAN